MKLEVLTLFPELFEPFFAVGLVGRAVSEERLEVRSTHLREFAINTHGQVDDTPYGGGSGMVLRPESGVAAIESARQWLPKAKVILPTPRGVPFTQELAQKLSLEEELIFLCPRYEGVDERIVKEHIDLEISLGDYVLMGGEIPSMAMIESITRLIPGVLGNPESIQSESFQSNLLEYPQYTKPQEFRGTSVPETLLSGNHEKIKQWRSEQAFAITRMRRPDLLKSQSCSDLPHGNLSVALIHHPVLDKHGDTVTTSITPLDLPDIARSASTFGLERFYVVHPTKTLRVLMQKICAHRSTGSGSNYNPNRSEALEKLSVVPDFDDVLFDIEARTGKLPKIITTSAKKSEKAIRFEDYRAILESSEEPHLLLLGTGWGLGPEHLHRADYHLEPINGPTDYNHLSVRAAAAIMFARLCG